MTNAEKTAADLQETNIGQAVGFKGGGTYGFQPFAHFSAVTLPNDYGRTATFYRIAQNELAAG